MQTFSKTVQLRGAAAVEVTDAVLAIYLSEEWLTRATGRSVLGFSAAVESNLVVFGDTASDFSAREGAKMMRFADSLLQLWNQTGLMEE